jgi:hypothetical protein
MRYSILYCAAQVLGHYFGYGAVLDLGFKYLTNIKINESFFQAGSHLLFYEVENVLLEVRLRKTSDCIHNAIQGTASFNFDCCVADKEKTVI